MPVPTTFSANTKAKSSEVNANFDFFETLIDNTSGSAIITVDTTSTLVGINTSIPQKKLHVSGNGSDDEIIRWALSTAETTYGELLGGSTGVGIAARNVTAGTGLQVYVDTGEVNTEVARFLATGRVGINETAPDTRLHVNGGTDNRVITAESTDQFATIEFRDNTTGATAPDIGCDGGDLILQPSANGDVVRILRHPRDNSGSATYVDSHIQSGWGFIVGDGSANITDTITLPVAYSSSSYRVTASFVGTKAVASGNPASEFDTSLTSGAVRAVPTNTAASASQFIMQLYHITGTFSAATNYVYHWIAIGPT